uniref:Histidine kinase/HSP90-like ATPase domain-containing protein n=1 Tax=viral metagenome TaxID=1070528 RepID=A0A6C0J0J0_9ZZZZ
MEIETNEKKCAFDADIQQLMHLIVHTFYSNRDIFLRELISNSSDALDKIRYENLQNNESNNEDYKINMKIDRENKLLTIEDTGLGMSEEDLLNNLGTIARSGTKNFLKTLESKNDLNLIGQFGVGFYSVFLVAEKVIVNTKKDKNIGFSWISDGNGEYIIKENLEKKDRGTSITIFVKEDALNYLEEGKIKEIIKQHSQYITYPINLLVTKTREIENTEEGVDDENTANKEGLVEDVEESEEKKIRNKITETYEEWEKLNEQEPIWIKSSDQVSLEEYNKFYKNLSNDFDDCLRYKHFKVEGNIDVKGVLFIPKRAPMDMFQTNNNNKNKIKLYVKRVFICDDCPELIPDYMNFVTGIIDSDDLPLTVSREMLQENKTINLIRKSVTKQVLNTLESLSESEEDYNNFYKEFSKNIKLGIHEDEKNRNRLTKLLRFNSLKKVDKLLSLDDYISNMKENQPGIYYITGESISKVINSPFLEKLKNKDYNVLFLTDAIDEYMLQYLTEYENKKLLSVTKVNLELGETEEEKKNLETISKDFEPLCLKIKEVLKTNIENVSISNRITNAPCCLVTAEFGWSANMERIMKAQTLGNSQMSQFMSPKKTFELNPNHNMIISLNNILKSNNENTNRLIEYYINILYNSSILDSGFSLDNPRDFSENIYKMMDSSLENLLKNETNSEQLNNLNASKDTFDGTTENLNISEETSNGTTENLNVSEETSNENLNASEETSDGTTENLNASEETSDGTTENLNASEETSDGTTENLNASEETSGGTTENLNASE